MWDESVYFSHILEELNISIGWKEKSPIVVHVCVWQVAALAVFESLNS